MLRRGMCTERTYHHLEDPKTGTFLRDEKGRFFRLTKEEANQIKLKNLKLYSERLQSVCRKNDIENLKECLQSKTHKSIIAFDCTFSACKDVSILWATASTLEDREAIKKAHEDAARVAFDYLESNGCRVRCGRGGKDIQEANAIGALFTHTTSRAQDPQLHSHIVLMNAGVTSSNGKTYALDTQKLLESRFEATLVYQQTLRHTLHNKGFETENDGISFNIKGVPSELRTTFSKRNNAIKEASHEAMTSKEKQLVVLKTRDAKTHIPKEKLLEKWAEEAKGFTWQMPKEKVRKPSMTTRDKELYFREVCKRLLHLQKLDTLNPSKDFTGLRGTDIRKALLQANNGKYSTATVLDLEKEVHDKFIVKSKTREIPGKPWEKIAEPKIQQIYALNSRGEYQKEMKTTLEKLQGYYKKYQNTLRTIKEFRFKLRVTFLYATGGIKHKTYLKLIQPPSLQSKMQIEVKRALGLISRKQYKLYKRQIEYKQRQEQWKERQNEIYGQRLDKLYDFIDKRIQQKVAFEKREKLQKALKTPISSPPPQSAMFKQEHRKPRER